VINGVASLAMIDTPVISGDRATSLFPGRVVRGGLNNCIVSFPGKYVKDWDALVQGDQSSACVFLPEDDPKGRHGQHATNRRTGKCWCHDIYGSPQEWGCLWFEAWMSNVYDATRLQLKLIAVFFPGQAGQGTVKWSDLPRANLRDGVGLGGSQKGEVAWLEEQGFECEYVDLDTFRQLLNNR